MNVESPDWPIPKNVFLGWTTRAAGHSQAPYDAGNLARHVGDQKGAVESNRAALREVLPNQPTLHWLNQTHSPVAVTLENIDLSQGQDAAVTANRQQACVVMTADCLPVYFWTEQGEQVGVAHAGWRGLAGGVLVNTRKLFPSAGRIFAGIGPAISQQRFEVGRDVLDAFVDFPEASSYFIPGNVAGKYWCDLPGLAAAQLSQLGVVAVFKSNLCTFDLSEKFYSYRRDGFRRDGATGRFANLIYRL